MSFEITWTVSNNQGTEWTVGQTWLAHLDDSNRGSHLSKME